MMHEPVLRLGCELHEKKERNNAILVPEIVKPRSYQNLLHAHHARHLRKQPMHHGGSPLIISSRPWYLDGAEPWTDARPQDVRSAPLSDRAGPRRPERKLPARVEEREKESARRAS